MASMNSSNSKAYQGAVQINQNNMKVQRNHGGKTKPVPAPRKGK